MRYLKLTNDRGDILVAVEPILAILRTTPTTTAIHHELKNMERRDFPICYIVNETSEVVTEMMKRALASDDGTIVEPTS